MPKYFLTTKEAADYCCVSVRQFLKLQKEFGIHQIKWMRKTVYAQHELKALMERVWQQSTNEVIAGTSITRNMDGSIACVRYMEPDTTSIWRSSGKMRVICRSSYYSANLTTSIPAGLTVM